MKNKKILIHLILQELRFMKHIGGLKKAGYETENINVDMLSILPPLMGVPMKPNGGLPEVSDEFNSLFDVFSDITVKYSDRLSPLALKRLAKACYHTLLVLVYVVDQSRNAGKSGHGSY